MGCKKTTVKILRELGRLFGPKLVKFAVDAVGITDYIAKGSELPPSNEEKASMTSDAIMGKANELEVPIKRRNANLLTEYAVEAVHGDIDESEIGLDDLATREEV